MKFSRQFLNDAQAQYMATKIVAYPDFPKPGIVFRDISPLLSDGATFRALVDVMCEPYRFGSAPTHIVGVESRGFILGAAMARQLCCGFVPVRKAGKLPGATDRVSYSLEYGKATLEIQRGVLSSGASVVIVDDLLATGGTAAAAAELVRMQGAWVDSFDVVIELSSLGGRKKLATSKAILHPVFTFED